MEIRNEHESESPIGNPAFDTHKKASEMCLDQIMPEGHEQLQKDRLSIDSGNKKKKYEKMLSSDDG